MADASQTAPTIELDGARLRPLRMEDAGALLSYLSDPAVTELTAYPEVTMSLAESMIERSNKRWADGELARWGVAVGKDDRLVGTCGFNEHNLQHRWAELAYDLAKSEWGKGLITKAAVAAIDWAFRSGAVDRVQAFVRIDNHRSESLLLRCGFVREGRLRNFRLCRGRPYDYFVYGLLREDWTGGKQVKP